MAHLTSRNRTKWLIVIVLIILAVIPFAIKRATNAEDESATNSIKRRSDQGTSSSQTSVRQRSQRNPSSNLPPTHKSEDLKYFILPPSEFRDVTLEEAMAKLFSQYREICLKSGERPISFTYNIEGAPEPIVFAKLQGSFLANLNHLAAMAGTTVEIDDDNPLFTEIRNGSVVQRRWTTPPTLLHWVTEQYLAKTAPSEKEGLRPRITVEGMLKEIGMIKEEDNVSFLNSSSTLIARAEAKTQVRMDTLVQAVISDSPIQTRISFLDEKDKQLSIGLIHGNLGSIERNHSDQTKGPNMQVLVTATEQGFGRKIQTVSYTGSPPSDEAKSLYLESGNVADLGVIENLTHATYHISRDTQSEPQTLTFKDESGTLHEKPFIAERIDATGRIIPAPKQ